MVYPSGHGYKIATENLGICEPLVNLGAPGTWIFSDTVEGEIYRIEHGFRPLRYSQPNRSRGASTQSLSFIFSSITKKRIRNFQIKDYWANYSKQRLNLSIHPPPPHGDRCNSFPHRFLLLIVTRVLIPFDDLYPDFPGISSFVEDNLQLARVQYSNTCCPVHYRKHNGLLGDAYNKAFGVERQIIKSYSHWKHSSEEAFV